MLCAKCGKVGRSDTVFEAFWYFPSYLLNTSDVRWNPTQGLHKRGINLLEAALENFKKASWKARLKCGTSEFWTQKSQNWYLQLLYLKTYTLRLLQICMIKILRHFESTFLNTDRNVWLCKMNYCLISYIHSYSDLLSFISYMTNKWYHSLQRLLEPH